MARKPKIAKSEASSMARMFGARPEARTLANKLLNEYLDGLGDSYWEQQRLVTLAAENVDPDEVAEDRAARLYAAQETQARH